MWLAAPRPPARHLRPGNRHLNTHPGSRGSNNPHPPSRPSPHRLPPASGGPRRRLAASRRFLLLSACGDIVSTLAPFSMPKSTRSSATRPLLAVIRAMRSSCGIGHRNPGQIPHDDWTLPRRGLWRGLPGRRETAMVGMRPASCCYQEREHPETGADLSIGQRSRHSGLNHPYVAGSTASAMACTCRASVPQQPPRMVTDGCRVRSRR